MANNVGSNWTVMQVATPSGVPPVGQVFMYVKSDGFLYAKNNTGDEYLIGPGVGAAGPFNPNQCLQTSDQTLPANYAIDIPGGYEISAGINLTLNAGSAFHIS